MTRLTFDVGFIYFSILLIFGCFQFTKNKVEKWKKLKEIEKENIRIIKKDKDRRKMKSRKTMQENNKINKEY